MSEVELTLKKLGAAKNSMGYCGSYLTDEPKVGIKLS